MDTIKVLVRLQRSIGKKKHLAIAPTAAQGW